MSVFITQVLHKQFLKMIHREANDRKFPSLHIGIFVDFGNSSSDREKRFSKCKDSDVTRVNLELGSLQVICAPAESSR